MTGGMSIRRCCAMVMLAGLAAAAGGCSLLEGLGAATPKASIVGVDLEDLSLTSVTLRFDVQVDNPYSAALPLTNVDYALASRGVQFLTGDAQLQGTVPAHGSKVLPVPVEVDFIGLLRVLTDVRPGATIPYEAVVGLSVEAPVVGPLRLPMTQAGQLDIPNVPSIRLP